MKEEESIEMEIFRCGDYGDKGRYSEAELDALVADYLPERHEAPLTLDHAQTGPAFGWVTGLRRCGDRLIAAVKGVPEALRESIRRGAFKKRSIELIGSLPSTGRAYLRAVSLLGAATPAVKGLRDVQFADGEGTETPLCGEGTETLLRIECAQPNAAGETGGPGAGDELERLRAEVELLRRERRERKADALFAQLRSEGVCVPESDAAVLRQVFMAVDDTAADNTASVAFGESADSLSCWLGDFLRRTSLRVPLGEAAQAAPAAPGAPSAAVFSERADPRSVELHASALALMERDPRLTYAAALARAAR